MIVSILMQASIISAQFYTVDFVADQASLITNDCGLVNPVYNTCFGIAAGVPNIIDIQPGSMLFIDVEGANCSPACSGGEAGGDNQNFYETSNIDVSGVAAFSITANFAFWNYADFGVGGNAANCGAIPASLESNPGCGQDFLSFSYSIDGGAWTLFDPAIPNATTVGTGGGLQVSTSGCSLAGTNVRIRIRFGSQSVAEGILIEDIQFFSAGGGGSGATATVSQSPICVGDNVVFSETGGAATMWQWADPSGSPAGTNSTVNLSNAQLTDAGLWSVTITDGSGCTAQDDVNLVVHPLPNINSNIDITICDPGGGIGTFDLTSVNTALSGGIGSVTWFSDQIGTLISNPTSFNASNGTSVYASVNDGTCTSNLEEVTLLLVPGPTANAGGPYSTCANQPFNVIGSIGGQATSSTWSTSGDGSFSNPNAQVTTYTPGPLDISSGSITITLTTDDVGGTCAAAVDMAIVNITAAPIAIPGGPYQVCQGQNVNLNGSLGGSADVGIWTTFGDGTFNNPSLPNAVYTPGVGDIGLGMVTLRFEASTSGSNCVPNVDLVNVTISPAPTIVITTSPSEICGGDPFQVIAQLGGSGTTLTWSSSGDGVFNNPNGLSTLYTPGPFDIASGSITIIVTSDDVSGTCSAATDQVIITVNDEPTVTINPVSNICEGSNISLSAIIGGSASSLTWMTNGDGAFSNPNVANTTYSPGPQDINNGTVTLEVTTDDVNGNCNAAMDNVVVNIVASPSVAIDPVAPICSGADINLNAITGGNTSSITWSTAGDGSFSSVGNPSTIYTPGPGDIALGSVVLIITTDNVNGLCTPAMDNVNVLINSGPTLQVDLPSDICSNENIMLNATIGGSATGINWVSSGDGIFDNPNTVSPSYTPGANDILSGIVNIDVTTISTGGCSEVTEMISFNIIEAITVSISGNTIICGSDALTLTANTNQTIGVNWSTSGDGTFSNPTGSPTDYSAGPLDITNGNVTIIITTDDPAGPCQSETATQIINITAPVSAGTANPTSTYCNSDNTPIDLFAELNGETTGGTWSEISTVPSSGSAFNSATATFNPDGQSTGLYEFEYSVVGTPPCSNDSEIVSIQIIAAPAATVATTAVTCDLSSQGSIINFDLLITAGDTGGSWNDDGPIGVDLSNTSSVDFDGIAPGNYSFTYTTNSAVAPCSESSYTTIVTVEDCACPSVATTPIPELCSNSAMIDLSNYVTTSESGSWNITSAPAGSNPATLTGNDFMGTGADAGIYTLTYTLDAAPIVNCPDSSVQTITIIDIPNAGSAEPTFEICNDSNNNIDLFNLLTNEDANGSWTETSGTLSTGGAFDAIGATFNPDGQAQGVYTFLYSINGTAPCPNDSEQVSIEVFASPTAIVELSGTVCNNAANGSIFNFDLLITGGDSGGSWIEVGGPNVDLTNTANVDFDGVTAGNYIFSYTTNSAQGACFESTYSVTITVEDCACPSVATTSIPELCSNSAMIDLSNYVTTLESGSWNITSAPAGSNPATLTGNDFMGTGADAGIYTLTFTLDAAPIVNCPDSSVQTITIIEIPNAGSAEPTFETCNDSNNNINLFNLLTNEDAIGSWTETSGSPSTGGAFDAIGAIFNPDGQDQGVYTFLYSINGTAPCPNDSEQVSVEVFASPTATVEPSGIICNATANGSIFNFDLLITGGDTGGSWLEVGGPTVDLSNPATVDFDGVTPGNYTFTYTTNSAQGACVESSYNVTITVEDCACPSVLTGMLPELCSSNGVLDLSGFVLTTELGTWSLTDFPTGTNPGTLVGNFFNGTGADAGNYTFTFTLDAAPIINCPDSSVQTLTLFSPPNSGMATSSLTSCNNDMTILNLSQLIATADAGGTWTETSTTMSSPGAFDPTSGAFNPFGQAENIYSFTYSLLANGPCPASSTEYNVIVEASLSSTVTPSVNICNTFTQGSILNFNGLITAGATNGVWQETIGSSGVDLSDLNNVDFDGVIPGNYQFTYTLPAGQFCNAQSYSTEVVVEDCACPNVQTLIVPDFCENELPIDLTDYNFPGQLGTWSITNSPPGNTPPSIAGSMLNIASGDVGLYELTFTLAGGPFVNCPDSSVLNFSILGNSTFNYTNSICAGDSIVINNVIYNSSVTNATETIVGGAANGCDSIVIINLTVTNQIQLAPIDTMLCIGEELIINGTVFNQSNLTGIVIFDQAGCDSSQLVTIDFFPPAVGTFTTTLCSGETLDINGEIFSETNPSGPVFYPMGSVNGCDSTVNVTVTFDNNIVSGISSVDDVCLGDSLALNFDFSTGGIFDIMYSVNGTNYSLNGITNGHVEMIYIDTNASIVIADAQAIGTTCSVDIPLSPLMINVNDVAPDVTFLTDFNGFEISCAGSSDAEVMIDISGGTGPYIYDWNVPLPDLDNLNAGSYQATITDSNGCRDSINFDIAEPAPTTIDLEASDVSCPGDLSGSIIINDIIGTGSTYNYSFNNIDFAPITAIPFEIQGLAAGSINLYIEDENECGILETTMINSASNLLIDVSPDRTIQLGDSVVLEVSSNFTIDQISWSPSETLSCNDCPNPTANPFETTLYRVRLVDTLGCEVEESVELRVEKANVYIPNAFSPNNDGNNDLFFLQSANENLTIERMIIVDRWGEIVFQAEEIAPNDPSLGWDGSINNKPLNPAVFIYYIQVKYPDGTLVPMKGDITLLR